MSEVISQLGGLANVTSAGLLAIVLFLVFWAMMGGHIVHRRYLEEIRKERDAWRDLALSRLEKQGVQMDAVLDSQATTVAVAKAVQTVHTGSGP